MTPTMRITRSAFFSFAVGPMTKRDMMTYITTAITISANISADIFSVSSTNLVQSCLPSFSRASCSSRSFHFCTLMVQMIAAMPLSTTMIWNKTM